MLMEGDYVKTQRREKHSMPVDPNNKHWVNDKSKFGYQMLLKMGWSEGKGLGTQEQGMTEHIVQNKMEERVGLGATVDTSSNWLENTSAYSQLLSSLRNKFNTSPSVEASSEKEKEEAVTPKCVMFAKRTRAKSIRTKSKQDLAAILGVRADDVSSDEDIPGSTDSDSESRKEKKSKKRKAEIEQVEELNIAIEDETDQEKKKKKKKKSKRKQETEQEEEVAPAEEEVVEQESKKDKKKKKSKKHREEVVQEEAVVEEPVVEVSEKKKKKKSKKHREEAVQEEAVVVEEVQEEPQVESSEKKKKKKKKNRDE